MGMLDRLTHTVFVCQGSIPGQYRASNESLFYVYRQVWQRSALLTTVVHGSFHDKKDADARAVEVQKEYTFS